MKLKLALFVMAAALVSGCSTSGGFTGGNANYAFPNSNITPIKQVEYSDRRVIFGVPEITAEDMQMYLGKALEQAGPDADVLINYTMDTNSTIVFLFVTVQSITLRGTAAKMVVGKQDLEAEKKLGGKS